MADAAETSPRKLILVKHAAPQVTPGAPPEAWELSEKGREACAPLARALRGHEIARIFSSTEPKAVQTAERIAALLNVTWQTAAGLHEHDRGDVPHMASRDFISHMELMFRRPDELVLGRETANEALARFAAAVGSAMDQPGQGNTAIVSHGTVIALFIARYTHSQPFDLWRQLGLPSFVVIDWPANRVIERVDRIA